MAYAKLTIVLGKCIPFKPILLAIKTPSYNLAHFFSLTQTLTKNVFKVKNTTLKTTQRKDVSKIYNILWASQSRRSVPHTFGGNYLKLSVVAKVINTNTCC